MGLSKSHCYIDDCTGFDYGIIFSLNHDSLDVEEALEIMLINLTYELNDNTIQIAISFFHV